jgi:hypothetical protein
LLNLFKFIQTCSTEFRSNSLVENFTVQSFFYRILPNLINFLKNRWDGPIFFSAGRFFKHTCGRGAILPPPPLFSRVRLAASSAAPIDAVGRL